MKRKFTLRCYFVAVHPLTLDHYPGPEVGNELRVDLLLPATEHHNLLVGSI